MAKRKTKHTTRRQKESSVIIVYKFVIYLFLVVVLGGILLQFALPMAENAAAVLGAAISPR